MKIERFQANFCSDNNSNNNHGIGHAAALCQFQHTGHVHGPKVSPDFLADAGENIDWGQFQQPTPRVGRVCEYLFFSIFSIFLLFCRACCNQSANIPTVSGSKNYRSAEGTNTYAPNSEKEINKSVFVLFF